MHSPSGRKSWSVVWFKLILKIFVDVFCKCNSVVVVVVAVVVFVMDDDDDDDDDDDVLDCSEFEFERDVDVVNMLINGCVKLSGSWFSTGVNLLKGCVIFKS